MRLRDYVEEARNYRMSFDSLDSAAVSFFEDVAAFRAIAPLGLERDPRDIRMLFFNLSQLSRTASELSMKLMYFSDDLRDFISQGGDNEISIGSQYLRIIDGLASECQRLLRTLQVRGPEIIASLAIPTEMTRAPRTLRDDPTRNPSEEEDLRYYRESFRHRSDPPGVIPWQEVDYFYNRNGFAETMKRYEGSTVRMPRGTRRFTRQTLKDIARMDPE